MISGLDDRVPAAREPTHVVGIGASAGDLEALEQFFRCLPTPNTMAFVVVQSGSPDDCSSVSQRLARQTAMRIICVEERARLEANTIYVVSPRQHVTLVDGNLQTQTTVVPESGVYLPIDLFLTSLARELGSRAIAMILTGSGAIGSRGVQAIKAQGGLVLIRGKGAGTFDGMPQHTAMVTESLEEVRLPPQDMPEMLLRYMRVTEAGPEVESVQETPQSDAPWQAIFNCLLNERGIDFSYYKQATMNRRIQRRMGMLGLEHVDDYVQVLHASAEERHALVRDLLVRVTHFFRDPEAFELLEQEVIPALLRSASERQTIRVWVPACSTGEEAYSIAMLFQEALEQAQAQIHVRIFATDVDRHAIDVAAQGVYAESIVEALTPQRLQRFFCKEQHRYRVHRRLREMLHFAPHNLMEDPPFTNVSLVSCRNCLIYLETAVQQRILACFAYALRQRGYLLLGPSEACGPVSGAFRTVHAKWKMYQKVSDVAATLVGPFALPLSAAALPAAERQLRLAVARHPPDPLPWQAYARLVELYGPPALILDEHYDIVWVLGEAHMYLRELSGAPSLNILKRVREELRVPVVTALRRIAQHEQDVVSSGIQIRINQTMQSTRLRVQWVEEGLLMKAQPNILICFESVEALHNLPKVEMIFDSKCEMTNKIYDIEQELSYTQENLQNTIEELEVTNEKLQKTNEKLVETDEELQSTNEELHSANEELYTVNSEYQNKIQELLQLNDDIDNLLRSTNIGTIFLDTSLRVRKFTPAITSVMPLMPQDIGRSVHHLALPFTDRTLRQDIEDVLKRRHGIEKEVVSAEGNWFLLRLLPFMSEEGACQGVVFSLIDITRLKTTEAILQKESHGWQSILNAFDIQIAILDDAGLIVHVNEAWRHYAKANQGEAVASYAGLTYLDVYQDALCVDASVSERVSQGLRDVLSGARPAFTMTYAGASAKRAFRTRVIGFASHDPARIIVMHEAISEFERERG